MTALQLPPLGAVRDHLNSRRSCPMGTMRILDHTGDTVVSWRADDHASVVAASAAFRREQARDRICFARRQGQSAAQARPLLTFDPNVEEMIWVRPVTAG